jgi:hypothetical protein
MSNLTIDQKIDIIYNEIVNNNKLMDLLNIISAVVGFYNVWLNMEQIDNNTIMKELDKQDNEYFDKIIKMLEEIKGVSNDNK